MSHIDRKWLNGPELVAWLEERGCSFAEAVLGYHTRSIREWRKGARPSLYQADPVLTKLDVHLDELPDGLWLTEGPTSREWPSEVKAEAVRRALEGDETLKDIAKSIGCSRRTVSRWLTRAA